MEEIKKAVEEADRGEFASEQEVQKVLQKRTSNIEAPQSRNNQT